MAQRHHVERTLPSTPPRIPIIVSLIVIASTIVAEANNLLIYLCPGHGAQVTERPTQPDSRRVDVGQCGGMNTYNGWIPWKTRVYRLRPGG